MALADVLPAIQQLTATEKLRLIRILAEDLDTAENIAPLEPFKTYNLPTTYDNFGVGEALMQVLHKTVESQ